MKKRIHFRGQVNQKLLMVLPLIVILLAAFSSCGKNKSTEATLTEVPPPPPPPPSVDPVFVQVDELPVFPDGDQSLINFIANNTLYPEQAKKNNIDGKVIVRFVVGKDCSVSNIEVLKGIDPLLDAEAIRVVGTLPKFEKPAKKDGKAVSVYYMLPITFALK